MKRRRRRSGGRQTAADRQLQPYSKAEDASAAMDHLFEEKGKEKEMEEGRRKKLREI